MLDCFRSAFYSASLYAAPNQAMGQAWTDLGFSCVGRVTARNFAQYVDTRTYFFTKNSELIDAALNSAIGFDLGCPSRKLHRR